ncbi:MAG: dipeptidase, partial [Massilibacteroides sp.]|nr:dipeptidase [Massilibacteroides sp.]
MSIKSFIETNKERFLEELFSLIRIPSISAKYEHKLDMQACAERWKELLLSSGVDKAVVMPTEGNPVVYAERFYAENASTVLVYAHYDVMPAEPLELWKSNPFEPEVRDGRIWARGADDDKGQGMIQVKGFETALKEDFLRCNVKFIFEGEEEIGSPSLEGFCRQHKELLKADVILVSDTSMVSAETPSLTTGLRGLAYWEIEVTGPNRDLHSGHFGGAVANPINVLCQMMAKITDEDGRITIPGFYDNMEEIAEAERNMIAQIPFDEEKYKQAIDVDALFGEKGYSTLERNSCRPCFDICGIWGGYTGEGSKTVLPSKAYAKVSCRLVPYQDHTKISSLFEKYIATIAPDYVKVKITPKHGGQGYVCPINLPAYQAAEKAVGIAFGVKPLAVRRGGSIPIISTFEQVLGIKTVLMGFGLE